MDETVPGVLITVQDIFETGLTESRDKPFLGRRPVLSTNPLKFADHYVWETYREVDIRRRAVGSALHGMFASGMLQGEDYNTVGIWSPNRPGMSLRDILLGLDLMSSSRMAGIRHWSADLRHGFCLALRYTGQGLRWCVICFSYAWTTS